MKKSISIIRDAVIFALFSIGVIAIFSEPKESSATWLSDLITSKVIGIAALLLIYIIEKNRIAIYRWFINLDKIIKEEHSTPLVISEREDSE